jgi:hypothetical protein
MLEGRLLTILLNYDAKKLLDNKYLNYFSTPLYNKIYQEFLNYMKRKKKFTPTDFSKQLPGELVEGFKTLMFDSLNLLDDDIENEYEKEITIVEKEILEINLKLELKKLTDRIVELEGKGEKKEVEKVSGRISEVIKKIKELEDNSIKGIILEK